MILVSSDDKQIIFRTFRYKATVTTAIGKKVRPYNASLKQHIYWLCLVNKPAPNGIKRRKFISPIRVSILNNERRLGNQMKQENWLKYFFVQLKSSFKSICSRKQILLVDCDMSHKGSAICKTVCNFHLQLTNII